MKGDRGARGAAPMPAGDIVEIFSGIQGEGIHVGRRHLFLRMAGCNLLCDYCDQPEARTIPPAALIERRAGRRDFASAPNPLSVEATVRAVRRLCGPAAPHHAVALTGGEPLMQAQFLSSLLPRLRAAGLRVFLETNGTRPDSLRLLRRHIDIVSMDIKLKSAAGRPMPVRAHERFLRLAVRHGMDVYVKAVVAAGTTVREVSRAAGIVARVRKSVPLVLQPVTAFGGGGTVRPPDASQLLELQAAAARRLRDVRVIPQTHKIMGQR